MCHRNSPPTPPLVGSANGWSWVVQPWLLPPYPPRRREEGGRTVMGEPSLSAINYQLSYSALVVR
jgi:hypothetical protein